MKVQAHETENKIKAGNSGVFSNKEMRYFSQCN
jgi:hypothetical protein